jgi:hypothetical protein
MYQLFYPNQIFRKFVRELVGEYSLSPTSVPTSSTGVECNMKPDQGRRGEVINSVGGRGTFKAVSY